MPLRFYRFVSLRTRFMLVALLLTLLISAIWSYWVWQHERAQLHSQIEQQGSILVSTMAIPIVNALLYEELGVIEEGGLLDNFVAEIMTNPQLKPLYAIVIGRDGRVLAHNRLAEFGVTYADPLTRAALDRRDVGWVETVVDNQPALDFSAPLAIAGKSWGCLRVGVSLVPLQQELQKLAGRVLGFCLFFSVGALLVFAIIGNRFSAPLITLAAQMEKVPEENRIYQPPKRRGDEIGQLQQSFARLLERLNRAEEEREQTVARLIENERLATIGKLVSGVAHEINNPLAGIQATLFNMQRECTSGSSQRYVDTVQKEIDRIGAIVHQLLDLSRAGALEMEPIITGDLFKELNTFAQMTLRPRLVNFTAKDLCPGKIVHVDRDKLYQVVLNLLLNAADAAGENGRVALRAYEYEGDYCLQVADNGPGVPPELREKIFELFFTTKPPGKGHGIGLATCRSIVERHGGRLEVMTSEWGGAAFVVRFPLTEAERA